jgi:large subunit ribosomal protein L13
MDPVVGGSEPCSSQGRTVRTFSPRPEHLTRSWHLVDAEGAVLGRLATEVAKLLRGKHKPVFAPHADAGDHVVVVNADKVVMTAGKAQRKIAYRHSGYPGGLKARRYAELLATRPEVVIQRAVKGMLPKTRLGRRQARRLFVYAGPNHPHQAQRPVPWPLDPSALHGASVRAAWAAGAKPTPGVPDPRAQATSRGMTPTGVGSPDPSTASGAPPEAVGSAADDAQFEQSRAAGTPPVEAGQAADASQAG